MLNRVLLIDDSEADLLYGRLMLERHGAVSHVLTFECAEQALRYLDGPQGPEVDLILLDINMPGMDGFGFLQAYERSGRALGAPDAPVVMLTSSPDPVDQRRAGRHACVVGYLTKPIDANAVRALDGYTRA